MACGCAQKRTLELPDGIHAELLARVQSIYTGTAALPNQSAHLHHALNSLRLCVEPTIWLAHCDLSMLFFLFFFALTPEHGADMKAIILVRNKVEKKHGEVAERQPQITTDRQSARRDLLAP